MSVNVVSVLDGLLYQRVGLEMEARLETILARTALLNLLEAVDKLVDAADPETKGWGEVVDALARVRGEA